MSVTSRTLGVLVKTFPKISETFILAELLGLERAGFDLVIYSLQRPTDAIMQPGAARLRARVVYVGEEGGDAALGLQQRFMAAMRAPVAYAATRWATLRASDPLHSDDMPRVLTLARLLREHGVAHLHAHFIDRTGGIGLAAARIAGIGCSISAHAKDIYLSDPALLRRRIAAARFVTTCTEYNRAALAAVAPSGTTVQRIYHGIDTQKFQPASEAQAAGDAAALRLLAVGRLRPKKGFATLVEACARLRERGLAIHCDIVGYGEERERLIALIERLGLAGCVRLRGKMSHRELIDVYREADVFVAPCEIASDGDRDGIPNVLLEAMAMQLAVVSTPVSGIPEVLRDGVNGLLVPPADPAALAAAIEKLHAGEATLRRQLGRRARRSVLSQFGEDANLRALVTLLERCMDSMPAVPLAESVHG